MLHSKLQNLSEKYKNTKSTYSAKQFKGRKKGSEYLIMSFYSKYIRMLFMFSCFMLDVECFLCLVVGIINSEKEIN